MYTYDAGGNISSKKIYSYTNGTVGSLIDTINYTYDTAWKDQLKTYDGQSITYDAIGNPLTYRDGMSFEWNGRQMKSADLNGTTVKYKYNADGLRTYKKVGSTVHEYEYSGGKLFYEKRGDVQFYYRVTINRSRRQQHSILGNTMATKNQTVHIFSVIQPLCIQR